MGLGGWLVPEGYMLLTGGSPTDIRNKFIDLVGEDSTNTIMKRYEENYVGEKDIEQLAKWGFNSVRVPFHYRSLSPSLGQYDQKGFAMLDSVIKWCSQHEIYAILDMHVAPGSQSGDANADSDGEARLWSSILNQDWSVEIWGEIARRYNNAHILTEVNDIGQQIAEALQFEIEYPNVLMCTQKGRAGQILGAMYSGRGSSLGVRMTKQIKRVGCANLKTLIEGDKLIINSFKIIEEMSTFAKRGQSWQAEDGSNDDLMMCLVIFGWLSNQGYFKELTNQNARMQMYSEQQKLIEEDMAPFGFVDDGVNTDPMNEETIDEYGDRWIPVVRKNH